MRRIQVSVVHRLRRPTGDETSVLRFMFVLFNLHFCFLLRHGFSRAATVWGSPGLLRVTQLIFFGFIVLSDSPCDGAAFKFRQCQTTVAGSSRQVARARAC